MNITGLFTNSAEDNLLDKERRKQALLYSHLGTESGDLF